MPVTAILSVSILLQFVASLLAVRLMRVTGRRTGWAMVAAAILLMAVRRSLTMVRLLSGDVSLAPDPVAESVALGISLLMVTGLACIRPFFGSIRQSEEALAESEAKLSEIIKGNSIATFVVDKNHTVTHWNDACESLTGRSRGEMVGTRKQWQAFYSAKRPVMADLVLDKASEKGVARYYSGMYKRSAVVADAYEVEGFFPAMGEDGKWLFFTAAPLKNAQGETIGAIETLQDITDRKRAEEELRKHREHLEELVAERTAELNAINEELNAEVGDRTGAEVTLKKRSAELEAANKELEAFSYSVSHDLRAPLRAIDGFSRVMLDDHSDKLDEEGRRVLDTIRASAEDMGHLIDDLLSFSRLGRHEVKLLTIDMAGLVQETFRQLKSVIPERQVELTLDTIPGCRGDRAMLREVLHNLLANAIKFTRLRESAVIEVGARAERDQNVYYVRDNGVGFDMQYAQKLFGVFQRLHSAAEFEGTGVGLAIVQRVIHRHGGRVWARARVDKGATFYFTLPTTGGEA